MRTLADAEGGPSGRGFAALAYAVQFFFGGWFFYNGLNYFAEFTPAPPGSSPLTRELMLGLESTGLFAVVKAVELGTGALLLANRFVPLAIAVATPVSFAIAWVMLVINGGAVGTVIGVLTIAFTMVLAWSRIGAFLPMLAYDDLAGRGAGGPPRLPRLSVPVHVVAIVLGIAAPAAIELGTMAYFQSVAAQSRTPQEAAQAGASEADTRDKGERF